MTHLLQRVCGSAMKPHHFTSGFPGNTGFAQPNDVLETTFSFILRCTSIGHRRTDEGCPVNPRSKSDDGSKATAGHAETRRQGTSTYDVCKVFSAARVTTAAREIGWTSGWALDFSMKCVQI